MGYYWNPIICFPHVKLDDLFTITGKKVRSVELIFAIFITLLFYFYEKKRSEPFINIVFLTKNLNISFIYVQYVLTTVIFFALLLSIPTYLQKVMMLDSKTAGMMMLSISIFSMLMTPIATRWTETVGFKIPLLFGGSVGIVVLDHC